MALFWFKKEIWPLIRKEIPNAQVSVYGAYPPREIMSMHQPAIGFLVFGPIPDSCQALSQHRVNLAPLRFGAGIKGKISDGWYSGTPAVATQIAAEGMFENEPWGGLVCNSPQEFAKNSALLYLDESRWLEAQRNGFKLINQFYSTDKNDRKLMDHLIETKSQIQSIRNHNIVGSLLRHNLVKSTKYFSKWIEAKNKTELELKKPSQ